MRQDTVKHLKVSSTDTSVNSGTYERTGNARPFFASSLAKPNISCQKHAEMTIGVADCIIVGIDAHINPFYKT